VGIPESDQQLVSTYVLSMQMGSAGVETILGLYAEDGVYVEHLASAKGQVRTHTGKAAIREAISNGMKWNPDDLRVSLDRLDIDGTDLVAHWTITSAQFPGPMKGTDRYTLRGGKIARLETSLD
jgi:hypothetical protein